MQVIYGKMEKEKLEILATFLFLLQRVRLIIFLTLGNLDAFHFLYSY